ncbi:MAG: hypothetical protein ACJ0BW_02015 [Pontiellaceae bacterium]
MKKSDYEVWNDLLWNYFFNYNSEYRSVTLYIDDELLHNISGKQADDFIYSIVKQSDDNNICKAAKSLFNKSNINDKKQPPMYFAYLCLFIYAWTVESEVKEDAYYERLRGILNKYNDLNKNISTQHFTQHSIIELWYGLEKYTNKIHNRELGFYTFKTIGNDKHIGISRAQALFNSEDKNKIDRIFGKEDVDKFSPGITLTKQEAKQFLEIHYHKLTKVTQKRYKNAIKRDDKDLLKTYYDLIILFLKYWGWYIF